MFYTVKYIRMIVIYRDFRYSESIPIIMKFKKQFLTSELVGKFIALIQNGLKFNDTVTYYWSSDCK